jgi:HTH-type transcriptional regulator/antitoxin HigA
MNIKPIRNEQDYKEAMERLDEVWGAEAGTPEADVLDVLVLLIGHYEDQHYPIGPSNPIEAIKFRMEQQGLTPRDLEEYIGSSGRVSEVLNGKRGLSLGMIKRLHKGLRIPYESLLAGAA